MYMPTLRRHWTVEDLEDLPPDGNRYEVIDGELFVTPAPSYRHQAAVGELYARLREYLRREHVGFAFGAPVAIEFSSDRVVEPDVVVLPLVAGKRPEHFRDVRRVLLAVEVVSPSSARADRVEKRDLYRAESVGAYWVVDLDARTIERSIPADPRVEVFDALIEWRCEDATEPFVLDLTDYFAQVLDA
jgi:Uma2 family endonuclease